MRQGVFQFLVKELFNLKVKVKVTGLNFNIGCCFVVQKQNKRYIVPCFYLHIQKILKCHFHFLLDTIR